MNRTILQILPATGFHAAFKRENGSYATEPVICWALVRGRDSDAPSCERVIGMAVEPDGAAVQLVDELRSFDGYLRM